MPDEPSEHDNLLFPDPSEIAPHAIEFVRLMFVHTSFEREVSLLQDAITKEDGFGEQPRNQWAVYDRPERMVELIEQYQDDPLAETEHIKRLLTEAIDPCYRRNFLAHGIWWHFNRRTSTIVVRGATRRADRKIPPEQREYTADAIREVRRKLERLAVELYKLRRNIEPLPPEAELIEGQKG